MHRLLYRTAAISAIALACGLPGCGKPSGVQSAKNASGSGQVIVPANAGQPAATPNSTSPANTPRSDLAGGTPNNSRTQKKNSLPIDADLKDLVVVTSEGQTFAIEPTPIANLGDPFQVTTANIATNSTNFVVVAAVPSAGSSSLIGSGSPKSGFSLPRGFTEVRSAGYSAEGLPMQIRCEKTGSILANVPSGGSVVGNDDGPEISQPQFKVRLEPFYMEIVEVTVERFEKYRDELKEKKKAPPAPTNAKGDPTMPALGVTWGHAQAYARWAGMELPTEAEFEKAARGQNGFRAPWGDGKPLFAERTITRVGSLAEDTSPYGIMDLAGNASEWCVDFYSATAHQEAKNAAAKDVLTNWTGPKLSKDSKQRVVKGNGPEWTSWHREGRDISKGHSDVGFRCVLRLPKQP